MTLGKLQHNRASRPIFPGGSLEPWGKDCVFLTPIQGWYFPLFQLQRGSGQRVTCLIRHVSEGPPLLTKVLDRTTPFLLRKVFLDRDGNPGRRSKYRCWIGGSRSRSVPSCGPGVVEAPRQPMSSGSGCSPSTLTFSLGGDSSTVRKPSIRRISSLRFSTVSLSGAFTPLLRVRSISHASLKFAEAISRVESHPLSTTGPPFEILKCSYRLAEIVHIHPPDYGLKRFIHVETKLGKLGEIFIVCSLGLVVTTISQEVVWRGAPVSCHVPEREPGGHLLS